jgi:hypothetical protein
MSFFYRYYKRFEYLFMSAGTKSFFSSGFNGSPSKSLYTLSVATTTGGNTGVCPDLVTITSADYYELKAIEEKYGQPLLNKLYVNIPTDNAAYLQYYDFLHTILIKMQDPKMVVLVQLALDALAGAINAYAVYGNSVSYQISNTALQNQLNAVLSGINTHKSVQAAGQMTLTKSLTLSPVYSYYIAIYGMPAAGVGFDPLKVNFLASLLKQKDIQPFS